ncbi:MAG: hypothetical protein AB1427_02550 [Thermodesulfobacteriota bacterium]
MPLYDPQDRRLMPLDQQLKGIYIAVHNPSDDIAVTGLARVGLHVNGIGDFPSGVNAKLTLPPAEIFRPTNQRHEIQGYQLQPQFRAVTNHAFSN